MAAKVITKLEQDKDVSWGVTVFSALLCAALGMLGGIIHLAVHPVVEVAKMPAEDKIEPQAVYYVRGADGRSGSYRPKEQAFLAGRAGVLAFDESELNSWGRDAFVPVRPKEEKTFNLLSVQPGRPNFRIEAGELQLSMVVEFRLYNFDPQKYRFQAKGTFVGHGETWRFEPREAFLGSAKLPPVGISSLLTAGLMGLYESQKRFATLHQAWLALDNVSVEGRQLVLRKK